MVQLDGWEETGLIPSILFTSSRAPLELSSACSPAASCQKETGIYDHCVQQQLLLNTRNVGPEGRMGELWEGGKGVNKAQ